MQATADFADVSLGVIFRAESKGVIPTGKNIKKIALALGVPESYLFQTFGDSPAPFDPSPAKRTLVSNINDRLLALDERDLNTILTIAENLYGSLKNV